LRFVLRSLLPQALRSSPAWLLCPLQSPLLPSELLRALLLRTGLLRARLLRTGLLLQLTHGRFV